MELFSNVPHESTLVWHEGQPVSRAGFIHAAWQLSERFPSATHCINLCRSRFGFLLGLVAAGIRGQTSAFPPNQTAQALQQLQMRFQASHLLRDDCLQSLDWHTQAARAIELDAAATAVLLHTSGSTGDPEMHAKTWGNLWRVAELDVQRFVEPSALNLVATVPSQHMYGLQLTALAPLVGRCAIHDSQPFFPADVRAALEVVPAPRALITTPAHLKVLAASELRLPSLDFILSATAPLAQSLARQCEDSWNTRVLEIYGSTEVGTIATRRTTEGELWQLTAGLSLQINGAEASILAAHFDQAQRLSDLVAMQTPDSFRLVGRASDQIKVAGKRTNLNELTRALLAIDGVKDGVMFQPAGSERVAALVVAPDLTAQQIMLALESLLEPVFLPRPLLLVSQLPRNTLGKIEQRELQQALAQACARQQRC